MARAHANLTLTVERCCVAGCGSAAEWVYLAAVDDDHAVGVAYAPACADHGRDVTEVLAGHGDLLGRTDAAVEMLLAEFEDQGLEAWRLVHEP